MMGALRIHALVILAGVLVRIGAMCRRRACRILDEAVAWCDARDEARRRVKAKR